MELNSVNSLGYSSVNQLNINQLKGDAKVELDSVSKPLKVDKIELKNQSSSFANGLINNVRQISTALSVQSTVTKQLDIVNKIEQSISSVISNPSSGQKLNDIQPQIKSLMDSFNSYSSNISTSIDNISNNSTEEVRSRVYFDGILGAKPLSSEEIFAEVKSQRERLQNVNKVANDEVLNNIQKSKAMFNTQQQELERQQPRMKEFDFAVESSNFEPQVIQKMQGSVVDTQANAQVEQNIKLLAAS